MVTRQLKQLPTTMLPQQFNTLVINTDGGSRGNPGKAACAFVVMGDGMPLHEQSKTLGLATNNEAEYAGFIESIKWLVTYSEHAAQKPKSVIWQLDSKLVVEQLNRRWKIKEQRLRELANCCWQQLRILETQSVDISITYVPREQNALADALLNRALDSTM